MFAPFTGVAVGFVGLASLVIGGGAGALAHPLDPLSSREIAAAVADLQRAGDADASTRFALIDLAEPDKDAVLAWRSGRPVARRAFVIARRDGTVFEGVVDLAGNTVERWQAVPGAQSAVLAEEWTRARQITLADPGWQAAMRRRGYAAFDRIFCAPFAAGYFADPAEAERRLVRVTCFDQAGSENARARPIAGLVATIDLDAGRVARLLDTGMAPLSRDRGSFGQRPLRWSMTRPRAPANPAVAIDGYQVRWHGWSFHYRMDRRVGLILSLLRHRDDGRERMVLYRGSLAEMFVPYMDPDPAWALRTPLDVGEYGIGLLSSPLAAGTDCPADAAFRDAVLPDDLGRPVLAKSVVCLFQRDTGSPLWRHAETADQSYAVRAASELVVRTIASVGNYDYIVDWVLTEAGILRIDVGATGIDEVKAVAAPTMQNPAAARDAAHGMLVAPHLVAVNHDHYLSFRLDVDIDGTKNTLVRQHLVEEQSAGDGGRRSLWRVAEESVTEEGPLAAAGHGGDIWRIVNPGLSNPLGQHPGYELLLGHAVTSLLAPDDPPQRRAAFSAAPLWITAYDPDELYAAGIYPNQSRGGDGLPAFSARHRPVEDADIVLWCTIGFHHLPRPEDWPVMPTMWHSLSLVPYGFFDRNPSVDRPAVRAGTGAQ
jgi:primary-amine oxidase